MKKANGREKHQMQPVAFPFLLSQNESGTTRGKMKGDEKKKDRKERNKKKKK